MAAEPKCPDPKCGVVGLKHIVSEPSVEKSKGGDPWFNVAFCDECGHVYGVFAKVTLDPSMPRIDLGPRIPGLP